MIRQSILVVLAAAILFLSGCAYWPRTLTPKHINQDIKDFRNDIDDSFGARDYEGD